MAGDSSSFAVGLVVGLGEGTKQSVQSMTCLLRSARVWGATYSLCLLKFYPMSSVWLFTGRSTRAFYLIVPHGIEISLVQGILCPINQFDGIGIRTGDLIWGNS